MRHTGIKIAAAMMTLFFLDESCGSTEFNSAFLKVGDREKLLSLIDPASGIVPGIYPVDIYLNGRYIEQRQVTFNRDDSAGALRPCLSADVLRSWAVSIERGRSDTCFPLAEAIPGASAAFNITEHNLQLHVPQKSLNTLPRDAVPATQLDNGITAGFVNYNLAASNTRLNGQQDQYAFMNLRSGLNYGAWRLRNTVSVSKQDATSPHWQNSATWIETDIPPFASRFVLGQASTHDMLFSSIPFRGAQLSSEEMMRAESQSRYAPTIRGVATTNARVEIRQNKYLIYATNVPAGPFEFKDIVPVSQSGDLFVTVIEADGRQQNTVVPFTTLPGMVRKNLWNYEAVAGRYHDGVDGYSPSFAQGQLAWGLTDTVTLSGGVLAAEHYRSLAVGAGHNFGQAGALQMDLSASDTHLAAGSTKRGGSARFLYAKSFLSTGTRLQLAGYRYSSSGFYDFSEAVMERRRWDDGRYRQYYWDDESQFSIAGFASDPQVSYTSYFYTKKERMTVTANQQLGELGQAWLSFNRQSYWQNPNTDTAIQSGFTSRIGRVSYSLFYQHTRSNYYAHDDSVNIRFSLPLSLGKQSATATLDMHSGRSGTSSSSLGLSGSLMEDNKLSYTVQSNYGKDTGAAQSASLGYASQMGHFFAGYSASSDMHQTSINANGAIVAHRGGMTLAPPLGSTFSLAQAADAKGVRIDNQQGAKINASGYAVVPYVIPYRVNELSLNTADFPDGLDIPVATQTTVPTYGAITRVKFETFSGENFLIRSTLPNGSYPPPGATVYAPDGRSNGVVGPDGELYVSGVRRGDSLAVRWGQNSGDSCTISVPPQSGAAPQQRGYSVLSAVCEMREAR